MATLGRRGNAARSALRAAMNAGTISTRAARSANYYLDRGMSMAEVRADARSRNATPAQRAELNRALAVAVRAGAAARGATASRSANAVIPTGAN